MVTISEKFVEDVAFSLGIVLSFFISRCVKIAIKKLSFLLTVVLFFSFSANALEVEEVQLTIENNSEILTIKLDESVKHRAFVLMKPNRLVIDLPPFKWKVSQKSLSKAGSNLIERIRYCLLYTSPSPRDRG